jgi:hypothetical protein
MTAAPRLPPRLATWLLLRVGGGHFTESFAGATDFGFPC